MSTQNKMPHVKERPRPRPATVGTTEQNRFTRFLTKRFYRLRQNAIQLLIRDWQTNKAIFFGGLLLVIVSFIVTAYYMNHPQAEFSWDSPDYFDFAYRIRTLGQLVDPHRLPGYPLFINFVFMLTGQNNMVALGIAQAILFILSALESYVIALLIFRRGWAAFLLGLLVGANLTLLTYAKLLLSEDLALWLTVSLALSSVLFVLTLRIRYLWLVSLFTLGLFFTRSEWNYVPVPLFAFFILVAIWHRTPHLRHTLFPMLACLVLLYAALGGYIYVNATQNNYVGEVDAQNINAFGKVLEYEMQNEAPPEYAMVARLANSHIVRGDPNPYSLFFQYPSLTKNHFALVGAYARAIILRHPVEFLAKSVPLALSSSDTFTYYDVSNSLSLTNFRKGSQVDLNGPFGTPLDWLQSFFVMIYGLNGLFPVCAILWLLLLLWRRTAQLRTVQTMGIIAFLGLYGLVASTIGAYEDFTRLHTAFIPLCTLVVWGTLLAIVLAIIRSGMSFSRHLQLKTEQ